MATVANPQEAKMAPNPQEATAAPNPQEAKVADNPQEVRLASSGATDPAPEYNGHLFQAPGQTAIYLILNGYVRHVPTWETFQQLFSDAPIEPMDADVLDSITHGPALTTGAMLIQGDDPKKTYLLTDRVKMWVPDPIFSEYHFDRDQVRVDPQIVLDFITDGPTVEGPHK